MLNSLFLFTSIFFIYYYYFYYYNFNYKPSIIKKTNNLYENWVKKPEINNIYEITKNISHYRNYDNLITIYMLEIIYENILKNINNLTEDNLQLLYLNKNMNKIYKNLIKIYDKNYFKYNIFNYIYKKRIIYNLNTLINYDVPKKFLPMDSFFRGIHQLIEINLIFIIKNHKIIILKLNDNNILVRKLIYKNIYIWHELIQLLNMLSTLDEFNYQHYRNLIYGTSGGESINLRYIQKQIQNMDKLLNFNIMDIICGSYDKKLLISCIKLYQYHSTQFWITHFNLAATTNGINNKGTQNTPIPKLIDKCVVMINSKINNCIHELSIDILKNDEYKRNVIINDVQKKIGLSVYNSSKSILKDV